MTNIQLIHGDCLTILKAMEVGVFDIGITSPPYNISDGHWDMGGGGRKSRAGIEYKTYSDNMPQVDYELWQISLMDELYRVAKPGASFFYNHKTRTLKGKLIHPIQWLSLTKWTIRQEIVWDRVSTHNHEPRLFWPVDERIYWMTKGKATLSNVNIGLPSVWREFGPTPKTWHPAPFTIALPRMLLNAINAQPGQIVIDPFSGSGTTIKAALEFGCDAIGIDVCKEYLDRSKLEIDDTGVALRGEGKRIAGNPIDFAELPMFSDIYNQSSPREVTP